MPESFTSISQNFDGPLDDEQLERWRGWIEAGRLGTYAREGDRGGPYLRLSRLLATIDLLRTDRERLRDALAEFGQHDEGCPQDYRDPNDGPIRSGRCTCGFAEVAP